MEMPSDIARKLIGIIDSEAKIGVLTVTYIKKDGSGNSLCVANIGDLSNSKVIELLAMSTDALRTMTEDFAESITANSDEFTKEQVVMMVLNAANRLRKMSSEGKGKTTKITEQNEGGDLPPKPPRFRL